MLLNGNRSCGRMTPFLLRSRKFKMQHEIMSQFCHRSIKVQKIRSMNQTWIKQQSLKITMKQQKRKAEWEWITRCLKCDSLIQQYRRQLMRLLLNITQYGNMYQKQSQLCQDLHGVKSRLNTLIKQNKFLLLSKITMELLVLIETHLIKLGFLVT